MSEHIQRITDHRGRVLVIRQDIRPVYSNPECPWLLIEDDSHLVGHVCYSTSATIDGEPANRRRVSQFIRRAKEANRLSTAAW
jgi:hypothetical protein